MCQRNGKPLYQKAMTSHNRAGEIITKESNAFSLFPHLGLYGQNTVPDFTYFCLLMYQQKGPPLNRRVMISPNYAEKQKQIFSGISFIVP